MDFLRRLFQEPSKPPLDIKIVEPGLMGIVEGNDQMEKIVVHPVTNYSDAQILDMLKGVQVTDETQFSLEDSLDLVRLVDTDNMDRAIEQMRGKGVHEDTLVRFIVSQREKNILAFEAYYQNFRTNALRMKRRHIGEEATLGVIDAADYGNGGWLPPSDLFDCVGDWHIPIALHRRNDQGHYTLVLEPPVQDEKGEWSVLVYDPMVGGEVRDKLPDSFNPDLNQYQQWEDLSTGLYLNTHALEQMKNGTYSLSVAGDQELAANAEVYAAKTTELQFDGSNCGPACVGVAAMRSALNEESDFLLRGGRRQMYLDTGVVMYSREEILGRKEPPSTAELVS